MTMAPTPPPTATLTPYVIDLPDGVRRLHLMVENIHCAACIRRIESALSAMPGVVRARVNMSTRRLVCEWQEAETSAEAVIERVEALGFPSAPFDPGRMQTSATDEDRRLLRALAVAGFAAGNVMLLSVSVWAGHASGPGSGMGDATRTLFHWVSALIALPAVAYAGQPFFRSAVSALRSGGLNMDVPISLAVLLAAAMSLYQTIQGGEHAYFDASVTLLFFLLVGRYLDHRARAKARSAAEQLLGLAAVTATVIEPDGAMRAVAVAQLQPGMAVAVAAGERIPVDGTVLQGISDIDTSLVTGESLPRLTETGTQVFAGTLNLSQPLRIRVTAAGDGTLLAEIVRLMEAAEQGRARYVRLADRIAKIYAPTVHILAGGTFLGWWLIAGAGWEAALMAAVAVLIITCPCAIGLAVPAVQVVASGRLMQRGGLLKSADGLERLASVDTVVLDKTGTLTTGKLSLTNRNAVPDEDLALAAAIAQNSTHPAARALSNAAKGLALAEMTDVNEVPGQGLCAVFEGGDIRLGRREWCGVTGDTQAEEKIATGTEIWLTGPGRTSRRFVLADTLRPDAVSAVRDLRRLGLEPILLSGDRLDVVANVAETLGIRDFEAEVLPAEKVARVRALTDERRKVLMVGDGLNDAPALAAGFASMSPADAADVSKTAADVIFQGNALAPVAATIRTARLADRLVRQNFTLAFLYNSVAVPLAVAGLATPLVAAVAMSSSSVLVTLNALRLRLMAWERKEAGH
ncbi:MAG: cadmium-translocating P-type ATPase [Alphaproteobacteria bacterium]|nr:cadmium-translocating P-type ATPase [Alphaproteobacteria bacterium]